MSRRRLASCVKNLSQISFKRRIIYYTKYGSSRMKSRDAIQFNATLSHTHSHTHTHTQHSMHKQTGNRLMQKHGRKLYKYFFFISLVFLWFLYELGENCQILKLQRLLFWLSFTCCCIGRVRASLAIYLQHFMLHHFHVWLLMLRSIKVFVCHCHIIIRTLLVAFNSHHLQMGTHTHTPLMSSALETRWRYGTKATRQKCQSIQGKRTTRLSSL